MSGAFLLSALATGLVIAQDKDCEPGTYIGKIGNVPVSMNLDRERDANSDERRVGSLYYRNSMVDMVLKQEADKFEWQEIDEQNKPSGRITLQCQGKRLSGEWRSVDGTKRFAVVAGLSALESYDARRLKALKPSNIATSKTESGTLYETFTISGPKMAGEDGDVISGFRLIGSDAGTAKTNQTLWQEVLALTYSAMDCSLQIRHRFGHLSPALGRAQKLVDIIGSYVIVNTVESHECSWGMQYGEEYRTYFLPSGRQQETAQWFNKSQDVPISDESHESALGHLIFKALRAKESDNECIVHNGFSVHQVYPSAKGLTFFGSVPTVAKFCGLSVELPYAQLEPFLSGDGKKAMQAIQKVLASRAGSSTKP